jgi:hypothetical protein
MYALRLANVFLSALFLWYCSYYLPSSIVLSIERVLLIFLVLGAVGFPFLSEVLTLLLALTMTGLAVFFAICVSSELWLNFPPESLKPILLFANKN